MDLVDELQEIRDRLEVVLARLRPSVNGVSPTTDKPEVPDGLVGMVRKDAIEAVLDANCDLVMPGRSLGTMRNKEIRAVLNLGGRTDREHDVDMYLGIMVREDRIERVGLGLYRAKRRRD